MDYWGDPGDSVVTLPEAPGTQQVVDRAYGAEFGGYPGHEIEVHASPVAYGVTAEGGMSSDGWWTADDPGIDPDYDVGGAPGTTSNLPYSWRGPVEPSNVENFDLTGRMLLPGRDPERAPGPVGADEYRSQLIMQIVQAMGPEITPEMAAVGLIGGV